MPRQERARRLGRVVGEGAGKIGHRRASFYPPFPWCRPEEKGAEGRGVEGGVIIPNTKPALAPTSPHPWHWPEARKGRCLGWELEGGRAGGNIMHPYPGSATSRTGWHPASDFIFWGGGGIKRGENDARFFFKKNWVHWMDPILGIKEGKMLPVFFQKKNWVHWMDPILGIKEGKMLPFFSKKNWVHWMDPILGIKEGKMLPVFFTKKIGSIEWTQFGE